MVRAGELAMRHGPCALPAVCAAKSLLTPRLRSSLNRVRPRFHCFHTTDRRSPRLFPNSLLEAGDGLGSDAPPRFSFASEAESEKLPLPWSSHGALRLVYLELETVGNEVCNVLHHSLSRSFAADIDVAGRHNQDESLHP
jgi:hypothetical protein